MNKTTYLRTVFIIALLLGFLIWLPAQEINRNMIQVKFTMNHFEGSVPHHEQLILWPDVSYKRFHKSKRQFVEIGIDILDFYYLLNRPTPSDIGRVEFRRQFILKNGVGTYLFLYPRLCIAVKGGLSYRFGEEGKITNVFYWGTRAGQKYYEPLIYTYRYHDIAIGGAFEFIYSLGGRWSLSLEGGGERFLTRRWVTKQQLWASLGVGCAF